MEFFEDARRKFSTQAGFIQVEGEKLLTNKKTISIPKKIHVFSSDFFSKSNRNISGSRFVRAKLHTTENFFRLKVYWLFAHNPSTGVEVFYAKVSCPATQTVIFTQKERFEPQD
ncbi:MAG: hypothetical protein ACD_56C00031G0003 [uncultured bacterium]|nr:MAG: hypothetical protein ACD_56C00031G0003 [uncultured bacterium]